MKKHKKLLTYRFKTTELGCVISTTFFSVHILPLIFLVPVSTEAHWCDYFFPVLKIRAAKAETIFMFSVAPGVAVSILDVTYMVTLTPAARAIIGPLRPTLFGG